MYFNNPIFSNKLSKIELMEIACEDSKINRKFEKEYILRDKYFKYVESFLPKTEHLLFRYIARYEDKNTEILNSPYILKQCVFVSDSDDGNIIFKCTNINKSELINDMKKVKLPPGVDVIASFMPLQVVLLLIIRYYIITKQPKKTEIMYRYYGYSIYWKYFSTYWKDKVYRPDVMRYTVNNMNYRYILKKSGSVKGFIMYSIQNRYEYYIEELMDCTDEDIRYILSACATDINNKLKEIYGLYKDNIAKNNVMFEGSSMYEDDETQRIDSSDIATIEILSNNFTNNFFITDINMQILKTCANMERDVSARELTSILQYMKENVQPKDLHEFFSSLLYIYIQLDNPKANINTVKSKLFFAYMMKVVGKGNSANKNIKKIRELLDMWLSASSNTFRLTTREGTKSGYRNATYYYFLLSIINSK